ncbi:hypothetical protein Ciccas_011635 [Cichlidogyrus casuarinus]|uniref:Uncharacterized protein n=1 Tax=Cichlidogyrus casuarinus TaxID=1844966 RepID=A0ABD2PQN7_9PLAT
MAASLTVCLLFWGMMIVDESLLLDNPNVTFPLWWSHATHSAPLFGNLLDIILYPPGKPYMSLVILFGVSFASTYLAYTEYLISKFQQYPYPFYQRMTQQVRYQFYGASFFGFVAACVICYVVCRLFSTSPKVTQKKRDKKADNQHGASKSNNSRPRNKPRKQE